MKEIVLPDKMSELLRLAIASLKQAEQDGINIDMTTYWAVGSDGKSCRICMAGTMLRQFFPDNYDPENAVPYPVIKKLWAVDRLRRGRVDGAIRYMPGYADRPSSKPVLERDYDRPVHDYNQIDTAPFYADMEALADDLEKAGL